jgi:hypothetical protein
VTSRIAPHELRFPSCASAPELRFGSTLSFSAELRLCSALSVSLASLPELRFGSTQAVSLASLSQADQFTKFSFFRVFRGYRILSEPYSALSVRDLKCLALEGFLTEPKQSVNIYVKDYNYMGLNG